MSLSVGVSCCLYFYFVLTCLVVGAVIVAYAPLMNLLLCVSFVIMVSVLSVMCVVFCAVCL